MRAIVLFATLSTAVAVALGANGRHPLFSSYEPLALRIEAPFTDLFGHKSIDDGYSVQGVVSFVDGGRAETAHDATISVRGHTSRREGECTFPKLKIDLKSSGDVPALLAGMKALKIGTHCGESAGDQLTERFGRLPNQQSPSREAFVYRLLDVFEIPTLLARPARITYVESSGAAAGGHAFGEERNAVIVEDDGDAIRRFGGNREIAPEQFTNARAMFSVEDSARLAFAQAMIGNFDWCVKFYEGDTYRCDARRKLWNVTAIGTAAGRARPLMFDFDVSGMVAGGHRWFSDVFNPSFSDSGSKAELEVVGQVQRTRSLFTRDVLDSTRRYFAGRKAAAYDALQASAVAEQGRQIIRGYLDSFFRAVESDEAFYRPVVTAQGIKPFLDSDRTRAVCPAIGTLPAGTVVSDPKDTRNGMIQVVVLDALWKFAPPAKCEDIHKSPVWIPARAVGRDYPAR